jgi:hypothetical protein
MLKAGLIPLKFCSWRKNRRSYDACKQNRRSRDTDKNRLCPLLPATVVPHVGRNANTVNNPLRPARFEITRNFYDFFFWSALFQTVRTEWDVVNNFKLHRFKFAYSATALPSVSCYTSSACPAPVGWTLGPLWGRSSSGWVLPLPSYEDKNVAHSANILIRGGFSYEIGWFIRGDADKSLARPGRKQAAATKLGIYSTYSPHEAQYTS